MTNLMPANHSLDHAVDVCRDARFSPGIAACTSVFLNRGSEVRVLPGALQKQGSPGTWAMSPRSSGAPVVLELYLSCRESCYNPCYNGERDLRPVVARFDVDE